MDDSSGATTKTVLKVSWYSDCNREEKGKKKVLVCSTKSSENAMYKV